MHLCARVCVCVCVWFRRSCSEGTVGGARKEQADRWLSFLWTLPMKHTLTHRSAPATAGGLHTLPSHFRECVTQLCVCVCVCVCTELKSICQSEAGKISWNVIHMRSEEHTSELQ